MRVPAWFNAAYAPAEVPLLARLVRGTNTARFARTFSILMASGVPVLEALAQQGALQAEPGVARLFIFGALNWSVQWFSDRGALSLDDLTAQALVLFTGEA